MPKPIADEPTKIADPLPEPASTATTVASVPTDTTNRAAVAQPDLLSQPPVTPAGDAQAGTQKHDGEQAAAPVAVVAVAAELPVQAGGAPADASVPAPSPTNSAALPAPSPDAAEPVPSTRESTQPAPTPPGQSAPAPIGPEQPSAPGDRPAPAPNPAASDPDSVPLPPLGSSSDQPKGSSPPTVRDTPAPTADQGQMPATPPAMTPVPSQETTSEDLPPLPRQSASESELKQAESRANPPSAQPLPPTGDAAPSPVALAPDDLPPLPQGATGGESSRTKADTLPPAAEDLPALPAGLAGNAPAGPDAVSITNPLPQATPIQPEVPVPAASQTHEQVSPVEVKASQPVSAGATGPGLETAASAAGAEAAVAVPAPTNTEALNSQAATAESLAAPAVTGAVMSPTTPSADSFIPQRANPPSTLRPELQRQVEEIARKQDEENLLNQQARPVPDTQPPVPGAADSITDLRTQTQTQVDISRAPSPAEARPIRAIPVPEDWVPLGRREWSAQTQILGRRCNVPHAPLFPGHHAGALRP